MKNSIKKISLIIIAILSSVLFLSLAFGKVEWQKFFHLAKNADIWLIALAILIFILSYIVRTLRWQVLIGAVNRVKFLPAFDSLVSGYAINNVLPMRAGEIFRLFITKYKTGISKSTVLSTLIIERVWDGLALLFLAILSLFLTKPSNVPLNIIQIAAWTFGIIVIGILLLVIFDRIFIDLWQRLAMPEKIIDKVILLITGFKNLQNIFILFFSLFFSILVWAFEGATYWLVAKSLNLPVDYVQMLFVLAILNFGILIPSSPGYVGTFEYFAILGLSIFGINKTSAASFAIILHIAQFMPITVYGGLVISKIGLFNLRKNFN